MRPFLKKQLSFLCAAIFTSFFGVVRAYNVTVARLYCQPPTPGYRIDLSEDLSMREKPISSHNYIVFYKGKEIYALFFHYLENHCVRARILYYTSNLEVLKNPQVIMALANGITEAFFIGTVIEMQIRYLKLIPLEGGKSDFVMHSNTVRLVSGCADANSVWDAATFLVRLYQPHLILFDPQCPKIQTSNSSGTTTMAGLSKIPTVSPPPSVVTKSYLPTPAAATPSPSVSTLELYSNIDHNHSKKRSNIEQKFVERKGRFDKNPLPPYGMRTRKKHLNHQ